MKKLISKFKFQIDFINKILVALFLIFVACLLFQQVTLGKEAK